jgi:hypothetical protein
MKNILVCLTLVQVFVFAQEPAPAAPAPIQFPIPIPETLPIPAAVPAVPAMSLPEALSKSKLPKDCVDDFASVMGKQGFNMQNFAKDLPVAVGKVKLQMKSPFGKPKDGDKTSAGITVGCAKALPENPSEISSLLKDVGAKAGLALAAGAAVGAVAGATGFNPAGIAGIASNPSAALAGALPTMSLADAVNASSLPAGCKGDFTSVMGAEGFSFQNFMKDLPLEMGKVKLKLKSPLPFGKPKDPDKTSVGVTVGCIKALPEAPAEMVDILKDIGMKAGLAVAAGAATDAAAGAMGFSADGVSSIPTNIPDAGGESKGGGVLKTIMSAGLVAGGLVAIVYGVTQNIEVSNSVSNARDNPTSSDDAKAAVDAEKARNIGYGVGAGLLASGLGVVIFF